VTVVLYVLLVRQCRPKQMQLFPVNHAMIVGYSVKLPQRTRRAVSIAVLYHTHIDDDTTEHELTTFTGRVCNSLSRILLIFSVNVRNNR